MEGLFLQSSALLRAGHNACQRREMTDSTNNGLVNGPVHNVLVQFFTLGSSNNEVFETYFFVIVTTQNHHARYIHHFSGRISVLFTLFWYEVQGGGASQGIGAQPGDAAFHHGHLKNVIFLQHSFI